jgi:hypothetical protein
MRENGLQSADFLTLSKSPLNRREAEEFLSAFAPLR